MRKKKPVPLRDVLQSFVKKNKLESGLNNQQLLDVFLESCPQNIQKFIQKVELRNNKIYVFLPSAAARQELFYLKDDLFLSMKTKFPELQIEELVML